VRSQSKATWVIGSAAILATLLALGAWALRPSPECPSGRRLDLLLGGGVSACLGGSFSILKEITDRGTLDLDNSGGGRFTLDEAGQHYSYTTMGGLAPFVDGARFAHIGLACVQRLPDSTAVALLAGRARARLAASWQLDTSLTDSRRAVWKSPAGFDVHAAWHGELCLFAW